MSLCIAGLNAKVSGGHITLAVSNTDPLVKLANLLDWEALYAIVLPDLQATEKRLWFRGRKLQVRKHLGIFLLGVLFNLEERRLLTLLKANASWQIFCGSQVVAGWFIPNHSNIVRFRQRLKPETQRQLANYLAQFAAKLGLAKPVT